MQVSKAFVAAALAAAVGAASVPATAQPGPSFSCPKARSWVERTICGDPALAEKDLQMARAYWSFVEQYREGGGPGTDISGLRAEQRAWLARRDQCRTRSCLHRVYDQRIRDLEVEY